MEAQLFCLQQKYPALREFSRSQLLTLYSVLESECSLTQHKAKESLQPASLCPYDFMGLDSCLDSFMVAYFNWRWFERDGTPFRLVTVEFGNNSRALSYGPPRIKPRDLAGKEPDYHTELFNCVFSWRWFPRQEAQFRVVTLETLQLVSGLDFPIVNLVQPRNLMGLPEDNQDWDKFNFYWRWFSRGDENFRVLTLE